MDNIYKHIEECNPNKKRKISIIFDDLIADITESVFRGRKLNISLVFITQSYFKVPKNVRINMFFYYENLK